MADRAAVSGDDRISALPLDVRLRLLSMLPVEDAVRSSELSREWRGLWKKMPSLRLVGLEQFETAEGFNKFVNHLIVLRGHLPLDKFKIDVRESETAEPYPYVNLWIQYALICKVRVLSVFCEAVVDDCVQLTVPLVSERLTTLNFTDIDFEKCSALVDSKLSLDFSGCPLLKSLSMDKCTIYVDKISSKSLKRLLITFSSLSHSRTWISAPSLVSLELSDCCGQAPVLESMSFLQSAFIRLNEDQGSCDVIRDLACCPVFGNLKTLLLNEWCVDNGLHRLVCILQHSPILEKLTLLFYNTKGVPSAMKDYGNHDPVEQTFACPHLKVEAQPVTLIS
ncbi:hypothetical protein ACQ4PT_020846 [Festuca glaucescens]